jgi:hypothetical protein
MNKKVREKMSVEWKKLLKNHPTLARVFLSQQAILIETSQLGVELVDRRMCQLLKTGLPVLFEDYWAHRCKQIVVEGNIPPILKCITELNRDPGRCFNLDPAGPEGWFDDPFAGGRTFPPEPPDPHI